MTISDPPAQAPASPAMRRADIVAAAAALATGLLAAIMLGTGPHAADVGPPAALLAGAAPLVVTTDTSVPDATAVFAGKDSPVEEPAPSF